MPTLTEIANEALIELKTAKLITDPDLPGPTENAFRAKYPSVRDAVLRAHPWNCALVAFSLPAMGTPPAFGFAYQYQLPVDPWCLRLLCLGDISKPLSYRWRIAGRTLLTDAPAPAYGWYVGRVSEGLFDPLLTAAIVKRLASELCGPLGNSTARKKELWDEYKNLLPDARSVDAIESGPEDEEISSIEAVRLC